jgi:hypothetical protein
MRDMLGRDEEMPRRLFDRVQKFGINDTLRPEPEAEGCKSFFAGPALGHLNRLP